MVSSHPFEEVGIIPLFLLSKTGELARKMLTAKEQTLLNAIEDAASDKAVEIVTLEITGAKKSPCIRVYIDAEGGVSFNELSDAGIWIGEIVDEIDPFPGAYNLEISSPGIDRPLRTKEHFARFVGEDARIKVASPIDGRSSFKGRILQVGTDKDANNIAIETENGTFEIPLDAISRANLVGKIEFK